MARAAMAGQLEHVEMADQVGLDVGVRILDRIAHPGLGAEMDDPVELSRVFEARDASASLSAKSSSRISKPFVAAAAPSGSSSWTLPTLLR